ncbi:MAG: hypothetical protein LUC83_05750 [Clostridiales bacterium]|nr:hypothetical protein [Clostridiales bacterium]
MSEIGGVDVMDLDFMDDTDFEALLNRYLEEDLAAAGGEAIQAGEAPVEPAPAQETVRARKIPAEPAPAQEIVQARKVSAEQTSAQETVRAREKSAAAGAPDEDDYDIPVEQGADYDIPASEDEDIVDLGALNMPDDEPEFYDDDDDDDDLEFL